MLTEGSAFYSTAKVVSLEIGQPGVFFTHYFTQTSGTTFQTGQDIVVRAQFINNGALKNTQDTNFRAVEDDWPVFAFAKDLGTISTPPQPVVFAIGHARDPSVEYIVADGQLQQRSPFFLTAHATPADAVSYFREAIGIFAESLTAFILPWRFLKRCVIGSNIRLENLQRCVGNFVRLCVHSLPFHSSSFGCD